VVFASVACGRAQRSRTEAENTQPPGSCRVPVGLGLSVRLSRMLDGSGERPIPSFLVEGSMEQRLERPTAENARRRQRTLYPRVSSEAQRESQKRSTVENARQGQRTLYLLVSPKALGARGNGAGSGSQTQRIEMLAGERSVFSLKRSLFYTRKIAHSWIFGASRYCSLSTILFIIYLPAVRSGSIGTRDSSLAVGTLRAFSCRDTSLITARPKNYVRCTAP